MFLLYRGSRRLAPLPIALGISLVASRHLPHGSRDRSRLACAARWADWRPVTVPILPPRLSPPTTSASHDGGDPNVSLHALSIHGVRRAVRPGVFLFGVRGNRHQHRKPG